MTPAGRQLLAGVLAAGGLAWAVAWALAGRQAAPAEAGARAVADITAVSVLGLAAVPGLDEPRHRDGLVRAVGGPLTVAAVLWLISEAVRVSLSAARAAGVPWRRLRLHTALEFAGTVGGRAAMVSLVAAAVASAVALLRVTGTGAQVTIAAAAALGIGARAVTGHLADSPLGAVAIVVHILAAALWCGTLLALALTVDHRGQWARVLPRFSALALGCVVALLVAGTAGALVAISDPAALLTTGYGRVLAAKVLLAAALLALGWFNRTRWLPAARAHRADAAHSTRRARRELLLMTVALTLAAALAVSG